MLIGRRYLIPYVRPFPIWRFGPLYRGEGWYPDHYGTIEVPREQAKPKAA